MQLAPPRPRRRPSLTPMIDVVFLLLVLMIDVVFLLLVFFMLASRFGADAVIELPLAAASDRPYEGPPRLVDIRPESLSLNGFEVPADELPKALDELTEAKADAIILRARDKAALQRVVEVMELLTEAGFSTLVLVE